MNSAANFFHAGPPMTKKDLEDVSAKYAQHLRQFPTGATRNSDANKYDYEGFISPFALEAFGEYMHVHRKQKDGTIRDSDNWQKGIPVSALCKSLVRHVMDYWRAHRGGTVINPDNGLPMTKKELLCAILFNAQASLHELILQESKNGQTTQAPFQLQNQQYIGQSIPGLVSGNVARFGPTGPSLSDADPGDCQCASSGGIGPFSDGPYDRPA